MEVDYQRLKSGWLAGDRDRELSLRLLFLAWMHWADPPFVTGMSDDPDADALWHAIFQHFGGETASDAEFLYVAAIMASLTPWALGDDETWESRATRMEARSLQLNAEGFRPEAFEGRGDYGEYFAHQARASRPQTRQELLHLALDLVGPKWPSAIIPSALLIGGASVFTFGDWAFAALSGDNWKFSPAIPLIAIVCSLGAFFGPHKGRRIFRQQAIDAGLDEVEIKAIEVEARRLIKADH